MIPVPPPQPSSPRSTPGRFVGNPYLIRSALNKVDHAFSEVIAVLEQEGKSEDEEDGLLEKIMMWRDELQDIRSGKVQIRASGSRGQATVKQPYHEGGLFVD